MEGENAGNSRPVASSRLLEGAALLAAPKPRRRRVGAQYLGHPFDFAQGKLRVSLQWHLSRNPDRFRVHELANSDRAEFATETGAFDAAKRQARIGSDHSVDEHHSGLEF
jgi:hypothetical protein